MIGNRNKRISVGESLTLNAKLWESDTNPSEIIITWDDIGEEPTSGYTQKDLTDYTAVLEMFAGDEVVAVGAVSIASDVITFQLDDDEVTERDRYYGSVSLENTSDTTETIQAFIISFEVLDEVQIDVPPLSVAQIKSILAVANSVDDAVIKRHIERAQNRMLEWISQPSVDYARQNGWPNRAIREGEYLAAKLLAMELYPDSENVRDDLAQCQSVIKGLRFDTDGDGTPDTPSATSITFIRKC